MAPVQYHLGQFPPRDLGVARLLPLVGPAHGALAEYQGTLRGIPNADILLSPLTTQEAVLSTRIEGTQATFGEVLEYEARGESEKEPRASDFREVLNYRAALRRAVQMMETLPLSLRVVKEAHQVLLQGVRGQEKTPGEFRSEPVWIGPKGCSFDEARFVPVAAEKLGEAISAWEQYLHADVPDVLIQLAVVHAEFEAVHPFLDGNGRLGRLLIPLFLVAKGLLSRPSFYMSGFLESHRDEYYERLLAVSRDGDWTGWCGFFLDALRRQAIANENQVLRIMILYEKRKDWIAEATRSQYSIRALDSLFSTPVFVASGFPLMAGIPEPTARRILRICRDDGMLREVRPASGRRPAIYAFTELLDIAEGRRVS